MDGHFAVVILGTPMLKLDLRKLTMETIVVESAEKASEN
jgi:hypothetical protein